MYNDHMHRMMITPILKGSGTLADVKDLIKNSTDDPHRNIS